MCVSVCIYASVGVSGFCLVYGFVLIETNHNISGETDKISRETSE